MPPSTEALAGLARTLGHAHRLGLLERIAQGECAVERLAESCGLSLANASQHLQHLRRAGLVEARRDGKRVLYRLGRGPVVPLLIALRRCAAHGATTAAGPDAPVPVAAPAEAISRRELARRLRTGAVVLIDVRSTEEFARGRLPGAINLPAARLARHLADLPTDREIVAYCRGPYCTLSHDAVAALRASGRRARRLENGFMDWVAAGQPVESPPPAPRPTVP